MGTYVSFFIDDVAPYVPGEQGNTIPIDASALIELLDYIAEERLAAAISVIPGMYGRLLTRAQTPHERAFAEAIGTIPQYPVDPHMEIMTHHRLFDFATMTWSDQATFEGEWLDNPSVHVQEYAEYFSNTIAVGRELGISYTGLSTPGTHANMNPNVYRGLLQLAEEGLFHNPVVPVFATIEEDKPSRAPVLRASRGRFAVYDCPSSVWDYLASWRNSTDWIDVNRYIDGTGKGCLGRLIADGAFMALFHVHWQGINPQTGLGWQAFQQMTRRLKTLLGDSVIWRRPSEIVARFHENSNQ